MIEQGSVQSRYTSTGKHSGYEVTLHHTGLDEYKHLFARDGGMLEGKIHNQHIAWARKWKIHLEKKKKEVEREEKIAKENLAADRTEQARRGLAQIEGILSHCIPWVLTMLSIGTK
ncbi:MAG: hypothetical protein L3K26_09710 [Candidatus Hydrogenedentes bacterium]|nr:hypothetical protein [Candidatus Hydrogenedentota bacterium]